MLLFGFLAQNLKKYKKLKSSFDHQLTDLRITQIEMMGAGFLESSFFCSQLHQN